MKKTIAVVLAVVMLVACLCQTAFAASGITVTVDDKAVAWTDAKPFIDANGRTLVPLRPVAEAMGLTVNWDPSLRVAEFVRESAETEEYYGMTEIIQFPIDSKTAKTAVYYNEGTDKWLSSNDDVAMDTAAVIVNDRTYAPVRYLAEFFGYDVGWDGATSTVSIEKITYAYYFDSIAQWPDSLTIAFTKGEDYDELKSVQILYATVNGKGAEVQAFTAEELKTVQEYWGTDIFYVFNIFADFESYETVYNWETDWYDPDTPVTVCWKVRETAMDGSYFDASYEVTFYVEGYGGYF